MKQTECQEAIQRDPENERIVADPTAKLLEGKFHHKLWFLAQTKLDATDCFRLSKRSPFMLHLLILIIPQITFKMLWFYKIKH